MKKQLTRRRFARDLTMAGVALPLLPCGAKALGANGKLNHASIGTDGMGWNDIRHIGGHSKVNIAAICDVDLGRTTKAKNKFPEARVYQDWRELLDKEGDKIDSINVTVPDHMHAAITMTALRKGKHVYCQKPLTHEIFEARMIAAAAKKAGVATQMGTQHASGRGDRMSEAYITSGAIGKIKRVYMWSNKDPQQYRPTGPRPQGSDSIPDQLNWDWWIGTAPMRPYKKGVYHHTWWRGWQDFGVGWLGDMGCHIFDCPYRSLKLSAPISVKAAVEPAWRDTPARRGETWPTWQILDYVFPGTDLTVGETITVTWSDGGKYPPQEVLDTFEANRYPVQGVLFIGEEGWLMLPHSYGAVPQLYPREKFEGKPKIVKPTTSHWQDWATSAIDETPTRSPFTYAGPQTEMVLLGTVALRCPDKELQWDAESMKITNHEPANAYIRRTYRKGWEVEGL